MQNPNLPKYIDLLTQLLAIPSLSSLPTKQNETIQAGKFVTDLFTKAGFETSLHYAKGHETEPPVVVVRKMANNKTPTALFYCHYDVQPVDEPGWKTNPFKPTEKAGHIYARGSIDDKGPLITLYAALSELQQEWQDNWPINVVCIFDGQEESGSQNLKSLMSDTSFQKLVKADAAILVDGLFIDDKTPAVTYGLRGALMAKLTVKRGDFGVHSGIFGGAILNPVHVLADIITKMYDVKTGKILLPGFYDDVDPIVASEKDILAKVNIKKEAFLKDSGNTKTLFGEKEFSIKEQTTARPSFDVNGVWGGYMGEGTQTVIPASASANISFRLVEKQTTEGIYKLLTKFLTSLDYPGIEITTSPEFAAEPVKSTPSTVWNKAIAQSLEESFGEKAVFDRQGGSGGEASVIKQYLGIEPVLIGYARPQDNYHGINEKISLEMFEKGIQANKLILKKFAEIKKS